MYIDIYIYIYIHVYIYVYVYKYIYIYIYHIYIYIYVYTHPCGGVYPSLYPSPETRDLLPEMRTRLACLPFPLLYEIERAKHTGPQEPGRGRGAVSRTKLPEGRNINIHKTMW